jgi:glutamate synthase domain-containing protein 3
MSGGAAYLYDPDQEINKKLNRQLAEILPMDASDFEWVFKTLQAHQDYTGSEKAKELLEQWDQTQLSFVKISTSTYLEKIKETKE